MNNRKSEGILAEFENPAELIHAAEKLRDANYNDFDCHSPFPIHGMDRAMGEKRSILGWIVGPVAFIMAIFGFLFEGWTSVIAYPLVISGKPLFSYPAFGVVAFALMILFSAFTSLFGMLALNKLPRYHHPVFYSDNFSKVSDNGFFVSIEATDAKYADDDAKNFLISIGGKNIEFLIDND
ncbi:MAG: hypothetical protein B6244_03670 [Candidatus Cloacimonetes bacterium 4572_55]|nr:MAG: hypothetical protein B6244_03670 [Candidatus Cloacimonetes bacterium 4572_55]